MAKTGTAESMTLDVFRRLRTEIVTGVMPPGTRLSTSDVRQRLGVSTGVLREAVTRLEMRGLLTVEPNRGAYVPVISLDELKDLTHARLLNETAALRGAVERGDIEWETRILAAHHRMARLAGNQDPGANGRDIKMVDAHVEFHLALVSGCGNRYLVNTCEKLHDAAELYRSWAKVAATESGEARDVPAEHRELLEAALARDGDLLVSRFEQHVNRTVDTILAHDWAGVESSGGEGL